MTPIPSLDGLPLWVLSVFGSDRAAGNPTGVIVSSCRFPADVEQQVAQMLGYPDTVFLSFDPDRGHYAAETYSPSEPIAFCVQSLLAAAAMLQHGELTARAMTFRVRGRDVRVIADADTAAARYWVRMHDNQRLPDLDADLVRELVGTVSRVQVVDGGRCRAFVRLDTVDALSAVEPTPAAVMRFCRDQKLQGLCAYAIAGMREIAFRVFTTSLDGREDASTGGAVAGLQRCCDELAADVDQVWLIEQGMGPRHRRGTLYLRANDNGVYVGGRVRPLSRGTLVSRW